MTKKKELNVEELSKVSGGEQTNTKAENPIEVWFKKYDSKLKARAEASGYSHDFAWYLAYVELGDYYNKAPVPHTLEDVKAYITRMFHFDCSYLT